jgi:hypothetical protein
MSYTIYIQKALIFSTIVLMYFFTLNSVWAVENTLRIPMQRSQFDISHDYHKQLLVMALNKAAQGRAIPSIESTFQMTQGRATKELMKGTMLDIFWLGTNKINEKQLNAIKVPTSRGLIGYRKFIIHKNSLEAFNKVKTLTDLKKFKACLGTHWTDSDILRMAELPVITNTQYESLFKMLAANRCDYFPRAYHDANTELVMRKNLFPNLIVYDQIILHYPFAVYFFTHKSHTALARWVEEGLTMLAKNGDIERFMQRHPLTSAFFPHNDEKDTLFLSIPNHTLPEDTNFKDPIYWILPDDLNTTLH